MMNVYLVSVPVDHLTDWDATKSLVVIAPNPNEARVISYTSPMLEEQPCPEGEEHPTPTPHWDLDTDKLDVILLGVARVGARPGVVCESNMGG